MTKAIAVFTSILGALANPSTADEIPGWHLSGSNPNAYALSLDRSAAYDGAASALLSSTVEAPAGFGALVQEARGDLLKGKRVRLTAYVKSEGVKDWAGLWFRVDGVGDTPLAFDNMRTRPIKGDTGWTPYSITLDIPEEATSIAYGLHLVGSGKVWLDSITWDVVSVAPLASSAEPSAPPVPRMPFNLDFED